MNNIPSDVVVWAMPRTGSTYIQQIITRALWAKHKKLTKNLHEAVSFGGIIPKWMDVLQVANDDPVEFSDAIEPNPNRVKQELVYFEWFLNEEQHLHRQRIEGDPVDEVLRRASIIKSGEWTNNVVFKTLPWHNKCRLNDQLDDLYNDAIINSKKKMQNIVTWRRDTLSTIASWMVMRYIKKAHGVYGWDGRLIEFSGDGMEFLQSWLATHVSFANTMQKLDPDKTVLVETSSLNNLSLVEWRNGYSMSLFTRELATNTKAENYVNSYINMATSEIVRPFDMLSDTAKDIAKTMSKELEMQTNWTQLDQYTGFRNYS